MLKQTYFTTRDPVVRKKMQYINKIKAIEAYIPVGISPTMYININSWYVSIDIIKYHQTVSFTNKSR